jgi:RNA recognition motif-containing protein
VSTLFMMNVPYNCTESELKHWVEAAGIEVNSVHLIRDLVAGVSPAFAYVDISEKAKIAEAVEKLNGHVIGNRVLIVSQARRAAPAA